MNFTKTFFSFLFLLLFLAPAVASAAEIDGLEGTRYVLVDLTQAQINPMPSNEDNIGSISTGRPSDLGPYSQPGADDQNLCRSKKEGIFWVTDDRFAVFDSMQRKKNLVMDDGDKGQPTFANMYIVVKSGESEISNGPYAQRWESLDTQPCKDNEQPDFRYYMKYAFHPDAA